jgi:hypothetical protein
LGRYPQGGSKMKRIGTMVVALMLVFNIISFGATDSIVDIAVGNEDFSILVAALQKAELVGALQGDGPFHRICSYECSFW